MISLCVFAIVSFNHGSEHCRALRTLCCSSTVLHCCVEARSSFVRVRMPVRGLAIGITARNPALRGMFDSTSHTNRLPSGCHQSLSGPLDDTASPPTKHLSSLHISPTSSHIFPHQSNTLSPHHIPPSPQPATYSDMPSVSATSHRSQVSLCKSAKRHKRTPTNNPPVDGARA